MGKQERGTILGGTVIAIGIALSLEASAAVTWEHVPGALVRSDCIHNVPNGANIDQQGNVTVNGSLVASYGSCPEPLIYTRPGSSRSAQAQGLAVPSAAPGGWVEGAQVVGGIPSGESFDYIQSDWIVPGDPPWIAGGATIFLFNGLEPSDEAAILQPVLQWGPSHAGGGSYWAIASWIVGPGSSVFASPLIQVAVGDEINGWAQVTSQVGNILYWKIQAQDQNNGNYSWITTSYTGNPWNQAYTAILEAYNIQTCSQLSVGGANGYYDFTTTNLWYGNPNANSFVYYGNASAFQGKLYAYLSNFKPSYEGPDCGFDMDWQGFWRGFY